jgi:hypothetical protein
MQGGFPTAKMVSSSERTEVRSCKVLHQKKLLLLPLVRFIKTDFKFTYILHFLLDYYKIFKSLSLLFQREGLAARSFTESGKQNLRIYRLRYPEEQFLEQVLTERATATCNTCDWPRDTLEYYGVRC